MRVRRCFSRAGVIAAIALSRLRSQDSHARFPLAAKIGATETGIASWYGDPYNGRRAASGEIYDMEQFTAAHRTLPFETWVEVTDLDNGKRVEVRIIDRGPFVDGRIIDLSLAAAREIDMLGTWNRARAIENYSLPRHTSRSDTVVPAGGCVGRASRRFFRSAAARKPSPPPSRDQFKDTAVIESAIHGATVWRVLVGRNLGARCR